jgi:hypothetical protein
MKAEVSTGLGPKRHRQRSIEKKGLARRRRPPRARPRTYSQTDGDPLPELTTMQEMSHPSLALMPQANPLVAYSSSRYGCSEGAYEIPMIRPSLD